MSNDISNIFVADRLLYFILGLFYTKRDKGGQPYFRHLVRVAESAASTANNAYAQHVLYIAGLLHDAIEDFQVGDDILSDMGTTQEILDIVHILTHRKGTPYIDYIQAIINTGNPYAIIVKYHDILDNSNPQRLDLLDSELADRLREKYSKALEILESPYADAVKRITIPE